MNLIGCGQTGSWEAEGWSIPASNNEFAAAHADFAPELLQLIRNVPDGALFKWGLRDRPSLEQWTVGRVAMLGDAAHPMTPFLGQGACMAIEDALVLGRAFAASSSMQEALGRYETARKPRGNKVQLLSLEEASPAGPHPRTQGRRRVRATRLRRHHGAGLISGAPSGRTGAPPSIPAAPDTCPFRGGVAYHLGQMSQLELRKWLKHQTSLSDLARDAHRRDPFT